MSISYELQGSTKQAHIPSGSLYTLGVQLDAGSSNATKLYAGNGLCLNRNEFIKIPHNQKFDSFGKCDDWTISFWTEIGSREAHGFTGVGVNGFTKNLISKYHIKDEFVNHRRQSRIDRIQQIFPHINRIKTGSFSFKNNTTPFNLSVREINSQHELFFHSSNGSKAMVISGSIPMDVKSHHILIRNSASVCEMFIDGIKSSDSGSIPEGIVANDADVIIGDFPASPTDSYDAPTKLAEMRMYDYAVNSSQIESLRNNDYVTGSLFQTNVIGNLYHRNGTAVISSPMPKYNSGSGILSSDYTWNAKWRGTHTIYENEVFVRIPQDTLNVTMNPTSTYKPVTGDDGKPCSPNQINAIPGEFRKDLFISGTLKPYITTIGLYNKRYELVAVGKLAQPIQKRDDVDMNFVIRWDY